MEDIGHHIPCLRKKKKRERDKGTAIRKKGQLHYTIRNEKEKKNRTLGLGSNLGEEWTTIGVDAWNNAISIY